MEGTSLEDFDDNEILFYQLLMTTTSQVLVSLFLEYGDIPY
jgi:hypothetical protein